MASGPASSNSRYWASIRLRSLTSMTEAVTNGPSSVSTEVRKTSAEKVEPSLRRPTTSRPTHIGLIWGSARDRARSCT